MNKVEKLKARLRNMREKTEVVATNALHAAETLASGAAIAYAEGRMSDTDGEWGYKKVPYAYMGGAALYLTGLFAGDRYGADLFSLGTGLIGGHLFRTMYESGLESKTTGIGRTRRAPASLSAGMRGVGSVPAGRQHVHTHQSYGTPFDGLKGS